MYYVKFCRAPSGFWVGSVVYKNGTYFASGSTLDELHNHIAKRLYNEGRVLKTSVLIESRQSLPSEMAVEKMSKAFKTRFWYPKNVELSSVGEIASQEEPKKRMKRQRLAETPMEYDHHTYEVVDGKLVIYGVVHKVVKLAEYNLQNVPVPAPSGIKVEPFNPDVPVALTNYDQERRKITVNDLDFE